MRQYEIMAKKIQVLGGNTGNHMRRDHVQNCSGQMAGLAHASKPFGTMSNHCLSAHYYLVWDYKNQLTKGERGSPLRLG